MTLSFSRPSSRPTRASSRSLTSCRCPRPRTRSTCGIVRGIRGEVPMRMEAIFRFDYGHIVPWVRRRPYGLHAIAGPSALQLWSPVDLKSENFSTIAEFIVREGQPALLALLAQIAPARATHASPTGAFGSDEPLVAGVVAEVHLPPGPWADAVRAITDHPKGAHLCPDRRHHRRTDHVPSRTHRRSAQLGLPLLLDSGRDPDALFSADLGILDEAVAWRKWLLRSAAGRPEEMQIMYGLAGERRLTELELPWLDGYENSRPVRIGNGAYSQFPARHFRRADGCDLCRPQVSH